MVRVHRVLQARRQSKQTQANFRPVEIECHQHIVLDSHFFFFLFVGDRALKQHPTHVGLWIMAASHEFSHNHSTEAARCEFAVKLKKYELIINVCMCVFCVCINSLHAFARSVAAALLATEPRRTEDLDRTVSSRAAAHGAHSRSQRRARHRRR